MDQHKLSDSNFYLIKNTNLGPVLNSFTQLFEEAVLHDVTLACVDGNMQSSKAIIALAFPLLETVLQNREDEFLVLIMPDFSQAEIRQFLEALLLQNLAINGLNAKHDINHPVRDYDAKSHESSIAIKPESNEISTEIPDVDNFDLTTQNEDLLIDWKENILKEDLEASLLHTKQSNEETKFRNICNQCGKAKHLIPNLCTECGKECCTKRRLKLHMSTHKSAVCNVCGKIFEGRNRFRLKKHLKSHTQAKPPNHLQKKYKKYIKYSESLQVLCKFCDFEFKGNANDQFISHVEKHIKDKESKENEWFTFDHYVSELVRLEESLTDGRRVLFKLRTRDKFGSFNCNACEFNSKIIKEVLSHRKSKHPEQLGRGHHDAVRTKQKHLLHEMKKRSFIPDDALLLNRRCTPWNIEVLKKYQPQPINQLNCDFCDFKTRNIDKLRWHKSTAHNTSNYECEVCGESNFTAYRNVKHHQMEKHDMWGGMVSCGHCEEKFTHESLRRHIKSMNGGYKKQCPECYDFFAHVNNHIKQVHKSTKKRQLFRCSSCKKNFTGRSYATHECIPGSRVQSQQRSTKCGICQESFSTYQSFNLHLQMEHLPFISREIGITGDLKTDNSVF